MERESTAMHSWRVTKYDPRFRDETGCYHRDEWISPAQIGKAFADGILTQQEYLRVESLYAAAVSQLWEACGEPALQIQALETGQPFGLPPQDDALEDVGFDDWRPVNGEYVPAARVESMVRWCLRDFGWCLLVGDGYYVHFGYDYYMFVGTCQSADATRRRIAASGLFVEPCNSPHHEEPRCYLAVSACLIGERIVDHEFELSTLSETEIAGLWPDVPALVGYRSRIIDADLAARIRRCADVPFDFEHFIYHLEIVP